MTTNDNRLHRSSNNTVIFGVAGGLAEYFDVDPTIVRVAWVLIAFASFGIAVVGYFILALVVPEEDSDTARSPQVNRENLDDSKHGSANVGRRSSRHNLLAVLLIGVGVVLLLSNFGVLWWWKWEVFWPLALVGIGVVILLGRLMRRE